MARWLRYHPLFEADVLDAADWYDGLQPNLGSDFLVCVRRALDQLIDSPERRTAFDYGIRYWPVQRFPYVVFYELAKSKQTFGRPNRFATCCTCHRCKA